MNPLFKRKEDCRDGIFDGKGGLKTTTYIDSPSGVPTLSEEDLPKPELKSLLERVRDNEKENK